MFGEYNKQGVALGRALPFQEACCFCELLPFTLLSPSVIDFQFSSAVTVGSGVWSLLAKVEYSLTKASRKKQLMF